jgi:hypothetical protein
VRRNEYQFGIYPRHRYSPSLADAPQECVRPPDDPVAWVRNAFGFVADEKQAAILRSDALRLIFLAARQVGKSTIAALRALFLALRYRNSLILMVSPVGSQAGEILAKATFFAAELGIRIRGDGINRQSLLLPNGSRLVARPAVPVSLRGYSKARLIIVDEAAYVKPDSYQSLSPILAVGGGSLWVISTPAGPVGHFAETWHDRDNGWERHTITAAECPRLTPEFLESERRTFGDLYVAQEYNCQFIAAGRQLLTRSQIKEATVEPLPEVHFRLREKTRIYLGLDIGKRQDHTAIAVLELRWAYGPKDNITQRITEYPTLVLRYATRLALDTETTKIPQLVRETLQRFAPRYGEPSRVDTLLIDATGIGHTVVELIRKNQTKAHIQPVMLTNGHVDRRLKDGYLSLPRPDMLNSLKMVFELGNIKMEPSAPGFVDMERELIQFQPSGDQQEHDDLVMAMAMAVWQAAKEYPELLLPPTSRGGGPAGHRTPPDRQHTA